MDGIIVPSDFTKNVLDNSGKITKPIVVIPESFPENFEEDLKPNKFINLKSRHNFLLFEFVIRSLITLAPPATKLPAQILIPSRTTVPLPTNDSCSI